MYGRGGSYSDAAIQLTVAKLWNTHFLVWVFVSECEKSLRAFAFLTRNRSLRSINYLCKSTEDK